MPFKTQRGSQPSFYREVPLFLRMTPKGFGNGVMYSVWASMLSAVRFCLTYKQMSDGSFCATFNMFDRFSCGVCFYISFWSRSNFESADAFVYIWGHIFIFFFLFLNVYTKYFRIKRFLIHWLSFLSRKEPTPLPVKVCYYESLQFKTYSRL